MNAHLTTAQRAALHVGPASGLPHDPLALVLYAQACADPRAGFAAGQLDDVDVGACTRALTLLPSPSADRLLTENSGSFGGLVPPTNVAIAHDGNVYLVDRGRAVVKVFDPCDCAFKPMPCIVARAPADSDACTDNVVRFASLNELGDPTGLAIAGIDLMIADRAHHRVSIVDLVGAVPRGALRLPAATGLRKLWTPFGVAVDSQGSLYVSDPDNARIDVFNRHRRWKTGWTGLGQVTHLAVACDDVLIAVIENAAVDAAGNPVAIAAEIVDGVCRPLAPRAALLAGRFSPNTIAVDRAGQLHLGVACVPATDIVFDAQGYPVAAKDAGAQPLYATSGVYRSTALDSRRRSCVWHRVLLAGAVPDRTAVLIQTTTLDVELDDGELDDLPPQAWSDIVPVRVMSNGTADALVRSPPGRYLWLRLTLTGDGRASPCISRIIVEFPRVSLRRFLPGVYGMDPAGADFTDRFTALFDTTLRSIETRIDTMHELFDASTAPAEKPRDKTPEGVPVVDFLTWLAGWIGVTLDRQWPVATRRAMLKRAATLFGRRGTSSGLRDLLLTFLGFDRLNCEDACPATRCSPRPLNCAPPPKPCRPALPPLILEHFRLRRWLFVGAGRLGDDAVLWGERIVNRSRLGGADRGGNARLAPAGCPEDRNSGTRLVSTPDPLHDPFDVYAHQASIFVPARVKASDWQRRGLNRLLAQEAPAHVRWQIEYVEPRFRVGVQAMIGLDSVIARVPAGMRLNDARLGQGSVLPPHPGRPAAAGISARVGETMRLA
jgi:phage tail-like protein